jgi:hypothetical protein
MKINKLWDNYKEFQNKLSGEVKRYVLNIIDEISQIFLSETNTTYKIK